MANVFQTPEYYHSFENGINERSIAVFLIDDQQEIVGVLVAVVYQQGRGIKGSLSRRSIIMGSPLVRNNDPELMHLLLDGYNSFIGPKVIYSQFRNMHEMEDFQSSFIYNNYNYEEHLNILIDLNRSEEELWSEVHSKRRNEIRKAEKSGISVSEVSGEPALKEAYEILNQVYRSARLPLKSFNDFLSAYKQLSPKQYLRIFAAIHDGQRVGVMLVLCFKKRAYDWFAGSFREHYDKCPNDALPWHVFRLLKAEGYTIFDFGGAGKPGVPYGVRDYKKKFGGELVNFGRYTCVHKPFMFFLGEIAFKIYRLAR